MFPNRGRIPRRDRANEDSLGLLEESALPSRYCGYGAAYANGSADEIAHRIKFTHWGLTKNELKCNQWTRLHSYDHCDIREGKFGGVDEAFKRPCFDPYRVSSFF